MPGDGSTQPVRATLPPNFALTTITAAGDADIYVNDERKGKGRWSGRLTTGLYTIEARKASHYPTRQTVEITAGEQRHIDLDIKFDILIVIIGDVEGEVLIFGPLEQQPVLPF